MKCLRELVPGCSRIAGKAGMLDEIINYVQALRLQIEFLSKKLAAVDRIIAGGGATAMVPLVVQTNPELMMDQPFDMFMVSSDVETFHFSSFVQVTRHP